MDPIKKLKYYQFILHAIVIVAIPYAIYHEMWSWLGWAGVSYLIICTLGMSIGYHRMDAHKAFKTYAPVRYLLLFLGMLCSVSSPLTNVLVHRTHHKYPDRKRDPQSPHVLGYTRAWFGDWLGVRYKLDFRLAKRELKDSFYTFTHQYFVEILLVWALLLALIDWKVAVYLYCVPAMMMYQHKGFVNIISHTWGYRTFETDDLSRNSWLMNLATLGDGWHNNHHKYPGRWNTQIRWWELDPAAWIIWLIKKPT